MKFDESRYEVRRKSFYAYFGTTWRDGSFGRKTRISALSRQAEEVVFRPAYIGIAWRDGTFSRQLWSENLNFCA